MPLDIDSDFYFWSEHRKVAVATIRTKNQAVFFVAYAVKAHAIKGSNEIKKMYIKILTHIQTRACDTKREKIFLYRPLDGSLVKSHNQSYCSLGFELIFLGCYHYGPEGPCQIDLLWIGILHYLFSALHHHLNCEDSGTYKRAHEHTYTNSSICFYTHMPTQALSLTHTAQSQSPCACIYTHTHTHTLNNSISDTQLHTPAWKSSPTVNTEPVTGMRVSELSLGSRERPRMPSCTE